MRRVHASPSHLHKRLECLPRKDTPNVPREGQAYCGKWIRACVWPEISIGTVMKRTKKQRVVEMTRRIAQGMLGQREKLLHFSGGGSVLKNACIERLARLTRTCRHAASHLQAGHPGMDVIGCTSTICIVHQEGSKAKRTAGPLTEHRAQGHMACGVPNSRFPPPTRLSEQTPAHDASCPVGGKRRISSPYRRRRKHVHCTHCGLLSALSDWGCTVVQPQPAGTRTSISHGTDEAAPDPRG